MGKREITIMRKKTLLNNSSCWYVQIDGRNFGTIRGGETKKILLDENYHTLLVHSSDPNIGSVDEVYIPEGNVECVYHVSLSTALIGSAFMNCIKIKQL